MRPLASSPGFRRRDAATLVSGEVSPNMTPMVDIVMVILIFFMAGSAFIGPEWFLNVGMARGSSSTAKKTDAPSLDLPESRVLLRLGRAGGATIVTGLGLEAAPLDALGPKLDEYSKTGAAGAVKLVVEPTTDTPYQDVIRAYDACQRAGFASVGLAKARTG